MAKKRVIFVIDDQRDRDVLAWLEGQENRSAALRSLIRREIEQRGISLLDVYEVVVGVDRKLTTGMIEVRAPIAGKDADEPPDVAATLDRLGL